MKLFCVTMLYSNMYCITYEICILIRYIKFEVIYVLARKDLKGKSKLF